MNDDVVHLVPHLLKKNDDTKKAFKIEKFILQSIKVRLDVSKM